MEADKMKILYDGAIYDAMAFQLEGELEFCAEEARRYGENILELCCGTGRLAIPLAEKGFKVTGIDITESMLEVAKKKSRDENLDVNWILGDIIDFNLGKKFDLIFVALNSMLHLLKNEDIESMFSCVKKHLTKNGRFIIHIFNPDLTILNRKPDERHHHINYKDPETGQNIIVEETLRYDKATQVNHVTLHYKYEDGTEKTEPLDIRILYPQEIDMLLKYNGFKIEQKYGDYDRSEFTSDSSKQIIVCSSR